eukprot:TRINITY_DN70593_c0_g1_i1.p1 TRINITY_DN70593_c0_g1~~TRINITY_DN70593_c0_g1_i1.p1  ORF type:complete len:588 (+),score=97.10 TRINITY_DN70593_c0_g1_i1:47-1765(+)
MASFLSRPKDWIMWKCYCCYFFRLKGSVLPSALKFAVPAGCVAYGVHFLLDTFDLREVGNLDDGVVIWSQFNFVIGMLLVFRTNQAYRRHWEGATLLLQVRGEWFNATSSLISFCSHDPEKRKQVEEFQHKIVRLMSMLYCAGLQQVSVIADDRLEIIDPDGFDKESMYFLSRSADRCEVLLQWVQRSIVDNMSTGVVDIAPPVLSRVFQELSRGIVNMQNVRKIAEIPFPFPYTQMIVVMLTLYTVVAPIIAAHLCTHAWWAAVITFVCMLALWSIDYIAAEIERPFGDDFNDLPLANMMKDLNGSLRTLLLARVQQPPAFHFDKERDRACASFSCWDANFINMVDMQIMARGFSKARSTEGRRSRNHISADFKAFGTDAGLDGHETSECVIPNEMRDKIQACGYLDQNSDNGDRRLKFSEATLAHSRSVLSAESQVEIVGAHSESSSSAEASLEWENGADLTTRAKVPSQGYNGAPTAAPNGNGIANGVKKEPPPCPAKGSQIPHELRLVAGQKGEDADQRRHLQQDGQSERHQEHLRLYGRKQHHERDLSEVSLLASRTAECDSEVFAV